MGTIKSKTLSLVHHAARAYTAGPAIHDAQVVCERLTSEGLASAVCYWNLATDQPERVSAFYTDIIDLAPAAGGNLYLSVKAPAIQFSLDVLKPVLDRAKRSAATVHFDAMAPETADRTFDLIARARAMYSRLGCTLPGRWRRSLRDADRAVELGLRVRVVKGEWAEGTPDDVNPIEGFLNLIDRLGAERARHVAVATHNADLAREALSRLRTTGTSCELELLYGLPLYPLLEVARALGVPARMYVPYGHTRLPYKLRHAAKNPRILGWFMRDLIRATTSKQSGHSTPDKSPRLTSDCPTV
jgi:proline dehydrogenase